MGQRAGLVPSRWKSVTIFIGHKLGVVLYKPEYVENALIRFPDGATVYLYRGGELHALRNGHTFIAMGYDFGDVKVPNVEKRMELKIGAELPSI